LVCPGEKLKPLKECKVLVTPTSYGSQDESLISRLEEKVGEVVYNTTGKPLSSVQLQEMLDGVDGMIAGLDTIDTAALIAATNLKVIARYGVGYQNVDLDVAKKLKITVTITPGANAKSVAEITIALMLNLLRPIISASAQTKSGEWPRYKGASLVDRTVGLLGLGAIGKETARRLAGFDCHILAYDPYPNNEFAEKHQVKFVPLDNLLANADIVSLHLPCSSETMGMVNDDFFAQMKNGARLINTARGELIDEPALVRALESGKLSAAALDVFQPEPPAPDNPLLQFEQLIATPHMGSHSDSATNMMGKMALAECLAVLEGKNPKYKIA
jgi:phosphoglycerate dehydrogenase-like enzyme